MKWDDPDYAEAIGLLASLIAAIVALKKAEKDEDNIEDDKASDNCLKIDNLTFESIDLQVKPEVVDNLVVKPFNKLGYAVFGLCFVAVIQLAIILFIAYRTL